MRSGKQHGLWFHLLDVVFNIVVIVAFVGAIRTVGVSPFAVEGNSMSPTLEDGEYIIINKLAYHIGSPGRGEIVVFRPPNDIKKYYVKRVIGVPGDTVTLRDGHVFVRPQGEVDDQPLTEEYLDGRNRDSTFKHPPGLEDSSTASFEVPAGHYFLLGDNRMGSLDSRSFTGEDGQPAPYVTENSIKGKVWFIALPITKIHAFEPPNYDL